jgi:hypothetical protein
MPYTPTNWVSNTSPALNATNLNHLTDELKAQATATSTSHTLPTWVNGGPPRLGDISVWNEHERVAELVAIAAGSSYTKTDWSPTGTNPPAVWLNKLETRVALNRDLLDASGSPLYTASDLFTATALFTA